jgi:hypothetical protein
VDQVVAHGAKHHQPPHDGYGFSSYASGHLLSSLLRIIDSTYHLLKRAHSITFTNPGYGLPYREASQPAQQVTHTMVFLSPITTSLCAGPGENPPAPNQPRIPDIHRVDFPEALPPGIPGSDPGRHDKTCLGHVHHPTHPIHILRSYDLLPAKQSCGFYNKGAFS